MPIVKSYTHSNPGGVVEVRPYLQLHQASGRIWCMLPTKDPVSNLILEPVNMSNVHLSGVMVIGGQREGRREFFFYGRNWYTFHGETLHMEEKSPGWVVLQLQLILDLLDTRNFRPCLKISQIQLEVRIMCMLAGILQQSGVPDKPGSYEGTIKSLFTQHRVDLPYDTFTGGRNCAINGAIYSWGRSEEEDKRSGIVVVDAGRGQQRRQRS